MRGCDQTWYEQLGAFKWKWLSAFFCVLRRCNMNHSWTRTLAHAFLLREFNTIAASIQRPMTIVRSLPFRLAKTSSRSGRRTDGRTETLLCASARFLGGWIKSIRWALTSWNGAALEPRCRPAGSHCNLGKGNAGLLAEEWRRSHSGAECSRSVASLTADETNSLFHLLIKAPLLFAFILIVKKLLVGAFKWANLLFFSPSLSLLTGNGDLLDSHCWTQEVIKRCYFGLFWDMNISIFFSLGDIWKSIKNGNGILKIA